MNNLIKRVLLKRNTTNICYKSIANASYSGYDLKNYRSLIGVRGPDASVYLQNFITNDIYKLKSEPNKSIYSMVLNSRGRLTFDILIYAYENDHYLIEIDSSQARDALKFFKMMKVKKRVELSVEDSNFKLYSILTDKTADSNTSIQLENNLKKPGDQILITPDPRYAQLGYRALIKSSDPNTKISDYLNDVLDLNELTNYKKHLFRNGIAENAENYKQGSSIPLEYNLVFLNGVSFDKGCYLGQELVAKTHYTGVIRKRIMPLKILSSESDLKISKENSIINVKDGKAAGKLVNIIEQDAIAMLRLSNIDAENLVLIDDNKKQVRVQTHIPKYWPIGDTSLSELKNFISNSQNSSKSS